MENTTWITGASSGIGKAIAVKFASNDIQVIASARRKDKLDEITELVKNPSKIITVKNDISDYKDTVNILNGIQKNFNISCLINNAGITSFKPFIENTIEEIDNIIDTNLKGSIYSIKAVLPRMIEEKNGLIINILSVAANKIFENSSIYAASKSGLELFSKVIREELRDSGIRIINVFPGATSTEIWPSNALEKYSIKMINADHLANLIYGLYSDRSTACTEEIVVRPITGDL